MPSFISLDIFYSLAKFTKAFKQLTGKPFLFFLKQGAACCACAVDILENL